MIVPNEQDLKPLYDAALVYGKASVESQRVYRHLIKELGDYKLASKTPQARAAKAEADQAYRIMDAARSVVNEKFPGLNLFCPAPHVGWSGEIESYQDSVRSAIESYVSHQWSEQNEDEITAVRAAIGPLPLIQATELNLGDLVYSTVANGIFRVVKVTPRRAKIEAENLLTPGKVVRLVNSKDRASVFQEAKGYKRITQAVCDRLMALHRSRQITLSLAVQDPVVS